jgi:ectoine hydroxylase-related dioxygenase (phytanoyl-CoA dioxygenase family)
MAQKTSPGWRGVSFPTRLLNRLRSRPQSIAEQQAFYEEHGYLILDPEIPPNVLDGAVADCASLYAENDRRVQDAWKQSLNVKAIATAPKVLDILREFYGRKPLPFQTLNFRYGTEQAVHSDTIHFNSMPAGFMVGVWVALEDMDMNNGPVVYYPGSQKIPEIDMKDVGVAAHSGHYPHYVCYIMGVLKGAKLPPRYATIKKGQAFLWASNLLHGGSAHKDPSRSRHSQVTHYFFENCKYYTPLFSEGTVAWRNPEWIR